MTEQEANDYLIYNEKGLFGHIIQESTSYAAVIKHPRKPNKFTIQVGGVDDIETYAKKFIKPRNIDALLNLNFNEATIKKLFKLDENLTPGQIINQVINDDSFSEKEKEKVIFKSSDLLQLNEKGIEEFGFSDTIVQKIFEKDIIPLKSNTIKLLANKKSQKNKCEVRGIIEGGISISADSPFDISGTMGGIIELEGKKGLFGITNWHVLRSNDPNDEVVSPGVGESKNERFVVGNIFCKPCLNGFVDVAFIKLNSVLNHQLNREIQNGFFKIIDIEDASIGSLVKKYGKSSGYREGIILSRNATVNVEIGFDTKKFRKQIMTSAIGKSGDSGSILVNNNNNAIGLLFAYDSIRNLNFANHFSKIFEHEEVKRKNIIFKSFY